MIEAERLKLLHGELEWNTVPTKSGAGQSLARCSKCKIVVWSIYNPARNAHRPNGGIRIVDVGTLDKPDACPPDVHIWTSSKQPWITLSDGVPTYPDEDYVREEVWTKENLERDRKVRGNDCIE